METQNFIVIKNDIILRHYHTSQGIIGIEKSLENEKITDYDEIRLVPFDSDYKETFYMNEFDNNHKFKKLSERVKIYPDLVPKGYKLEDEKIRIMTLQEKVEEGLIEIDPKMKVIDNEIILKTNEELIIDGIKTQKEIDDEIKQIENEKLIQDKIREMAIIELEKEGKLK